MRFPTSGDDRESYFEIVKEVLKRRVLVCSLLDQHGGFEQASTTGMISDNSAMVSDVCRGGNHGQEFGEATTASDRLEMPVPLKTVTECHQIYKFSSPR